jgi:hypothetical protein
MGRTHECHPAWNLYRNHELVITALPIRKRRKNLGPGTDKPDFVPSRECGTSTVIYLKPSKESLPRRRSAKAERRRGATYPRLKAGPASRLFCLAPEGVYPATDFTIGAVGSYPTFSPLPRTEVRGGLFSVTLSVDLP